ncbi:MAG TPA: protein kinase [Thermoanaerobaculia bacterium]|jgi:serine/threonine-protein kinase|nr:protein kinase [Thermoanaerobaculia bacterium]
MSATERATPRPTTSPPPIGSGLKLPAPEPPRFSLSLKIFFAAALLILIAVGGAIAISAARSRGIADAKIADDLKKAGPAWESFQRNRYEELHRALAVVVNNAGTISMMAEKDAATTFDTLKREQASSARADFLIAIDAAGTAFARTDKPLPYSRDMRAVPTIAAALQGEQDAEGIWLSDRKLYHVVAAPVLQGGSQTVGVIAAGFQINDDVASSLKSLVNAEVVFLADTARLEEPAKPVVAASTMHDTSAAVLSAILATPRLVPAVLREGKAIGPLPLDVSGDAYLAYFLPIRSSTDQLVGAAVPLRSRDRELAPFRRIQNMQVLVGLAALVIAFVLSFVLARRITGPVDRLVRATEAVRMGNLETELPVESTDEIGILARSFRAMLEELKEKAALEKYVASLTMSLGGEETLLATRVQGTSAAVSHNEPQIGTLFAGRYEIQTVLGKGGMGIVYKAHDRELDDLVAIKTLRGEVLSADPSLLDRFKQEIRLARRITHPNVLRTHDLGESNGLRFLSMEFVKGLTLKHLLETGEILPTPVGLRIAKQVCAGLAAAHEVGVIHRDVKPQNIIIEPTGGLKIMDFGIARLTEDRGMTATGTVIGTPDYMSPEQARGLALDYRSDIYSTGVVLYEVFTGSLPFEGDSPLAVVLKHVNDAPPLPQSKNPRIDPKIAAIVMKSIEKDPGARFQNVGELYEALAKVTARQAA